MSSLSPDQFGSYGHQRDRWYHASDSPLWTPRPEPMHLGPLTAAQDRARIIQEQGGTPRAYVHEVSWPGPVDEDVHRDDIANFVTRSGRRGGAHRELLYEERNEDRQGNPWFPKPAKEFGRLGRKFHVEGKALVYENTVEADGMDSMVVPDATKLRHHGTVPL